MPGTLYIVATPIGNLEDMTPRGIRILKEVDIIAAEDTRHTRKLLTHFSISTQLVSYYREKELQRSKDLVRKLLDGINVALVSDAGTPAISDPGAILVQEARREGITTVPIPGASALSAAVSCAGLSPGSFLFIGFPPAKRGQRRTLLQSLATSPYPLVFYKSPHRVHRFIKDALELLGNRVVLWAREISKKYEDIQESTLTELAENIGHEKIRGELVLIIHPGVKEEPSGENLEDILRWYYENSDLSMKDICKKVAADMDIGRSELYQQALVIWGKKQP